MARHLRLVTSPPPVVPPPDPFEQEARDLVRAWIESPITLDREPLDELVLRIAARLAAASPGSESHG